MLFVLKIIKESQITVLFEHQMNTLKYENRKEFFMSQY